MQTTKKRRITDKDDFIFYLALIALPILQVIIFYFYVNFNSVLLAFKKYDKINDTFIWNQCANFTKFWKEIKDGLFLTKLKNSFVVWFFVSVLGTFLSVLFSYYIFKKWNLHKTFKFILFLPSVLPSILLVTTYKFFMNEAVGQFFQEVFNKKLGALLVKPEYKLPLIYFYNVWVCFGAQILIYSGAMDQISPDILEAGQVDGVNSIREFFSIVIPIILPTVATFFIASVATLFTNQANLYAFFGANLADEFHTIGYYLFYLVEKEPKMAEYGYASAIGIICTLIAFPLTLVARRLLIGKGDD